MGCLSSLKGRRQAADPIREDCPQLPKVFRHGGHNQGRTG